jgi:hypothetical protein
VKVISNSIGIQLRNFTTEISFEVFMAKRFQIVLSWVLMRGMFMARFTTPSAPPPTQRRVIR